MIIILAIALVSALAFGFWAFTGRQDYKNNFDKKASAAVEQAKATQKIELQKQFDEASKLPYKTYSGSATYGSITFNYPKTWSVYVDENSSQPLNAYFYPDVVPGLQTKIAFALRVELVNSDYASVLTLHDAQITDGTLKARAYVPPKMQGVANIQPGVRLDGTISQDKQGAMVVMKVRDKTLTIYAESKDFVSDFNTVLESLTFAP
ncbi:hypothetical protein HYW35_04015 [Candidatus Saccharibacteria bacterium]|nr:hypothetical protein [Candidatus Saccharibacteria bacterium]